MPAINRTICLRRPVQRDKIDIWAIFRAVLIDKNLQNPRLAFYTRSLKHSHSLKQFKNKGEYFDNIETDTRSQNLTILKSAVKTIQGVVALHGVSQCLPSDSFDG